jgi:uncharacterized membrane protein HdeD (DUF308 family)
MATTLHDTRLPASNLDQDELAAALRARLHARWRFLLFQGIAMIVLGTLAIALPVLTTLAIEVLIGWLLVIGGVWRAIHIMRANAGPGFGSSLALALFAVILGAMLLMLPLPGILTLTMLLFVLFMLDGVGKIMLALDLRKHAREWMWPLLTGITDLILAALIVAGWPSTAAWAIGLLVGVNMIFFGVALTVIALAARRERQADLNKIVRPENSYVSPQEPRPAR